MKFTFLVAPLVLGAVICAAIPAVAQIQPYQVQPYQPNPWRPIPGQPYQPPSPFTYPVPTLGQPTTHCVVTGYTAAGAVMRCTTY